MYHTCGTLHLINKTCTWIRFCEIRIYFIWKSNLAINKTPVVTQYLLQIDYYFLFNRRKLISYWQKKLLAKQLERTRAWGVSGLINSNSKMEIVLNVHQSILLKWIERLFQILFLLCDSAHSVRSDRSLSGFLHLAVVSVKYLVMYPQSNTGNIKYPLYLSSKQLLPSISIRKIKKGFYIIYLSKSQVSSGFWFCLRMMSCLRESPQTESQCL